MGLQVGLEAGGIVGLLAFVDAIALDTLEDLLDAHNALHVVGVYRLIPARFGIASGTQRIHQVSQGFIAEYIDDSLGFLYDEIECNSRNATRELARI